MLSEFIRSVHSYSALPLAGTADRPEVRSTRSSRTKVKSPQNSTPAVDRRPTCLTLVINDYSLQWTIASSWNCFHNCWYLVSTGKKNQNLNIKSQNFIFDFWFFIFNLCSSLGIIHIMDSTEINQLDPPPSFLLKSWWGPPWCDCVSLPRDKILILFYGVYLLYSWQNFSFCYEFLDENN